MLSDKPLNGKAYGSIPHLPGSKFGNRDDKGIDDKAARFFLDKPGKYDTIIVTEKVDGSCVSVANVDGEIIPMIRSGYRAATSKYLQHRMFHEWATERINKFAALQPGQRLCGEWLAQAHGTKYDLTGREPFVAFDFFNGMERLPFQVTSGYCDMHGLMYVPVMYYGEGIGCSIKQALEMLGEHGYYGALESAEGCVWRWERKDPEMPIMMAKFVRPEKEIGKYLESNTGKLPVWNWRPIDDL